MVLAAGVIDAANNVRVTFQLTDDGARVDVVDSSHTHPFRDDAERYAVVLLACVRGVPGPMQMQDHAVLPAPFRHRLDRRIADDKVDHDDDAAELLGELRPLVHVFHGRAGHVEVMALDLARLGDGLVDALHAIEEAVTPMHERL